MLELFIDGKSDRIDGIVERLDEMVLAHRVVEVSSPGEVTSASELPTLKDGERTISGIRAIEQYLLKLQDQSDEWRRFQSDACYLDEEGEPC